MKYHYPNIKDVKLVLRCFCKYILYALFIYLSLYFLLTMPFSHQPRDVKRNMTCRVYMFSFHEKPIRGPFTITPYFSTEGTETAYYFFGVLDKLLYTSFTRPFWDQPRQYPPATFSNSSAQPCETSTVNMFSVYFCLFFPLLHLLVVCMKHHKKPKAIEIFYVLQIIALFIFIVWTWHLFFSWKMNGILVYNYMACTLTLFGIHATKIYKQLSCSIPSMAISICPVLLGCYIGIGEMIYFVIIHL